MSLRAKLLLIFIACVVAPLLALTVFNYVSGTRSVELMLREDAGKDLSRMTRGIEATLAAHEESLKELARASRTLATHMRDTSPGTTDDPRASLERFFIAHRGHFQSLTMFDAAGRPVLRVDGAPGAGGAVRFQSEDFVPSTLHYDSRVRELTGGQVLRAPLTGEAYGTGMCITAPVFKNESVGTPDGALVAELNLDAILKDAARDTFGPEPESNLSGDAAPLSSVSSPPRPTRRIVVALDDDAGRILYHTNGALMHQLASSSMPFFGGVAERMKAGARGVQFYETTEGDRWLAAFGQVKNLNVSLAVAEDYSAATSGLRRNGLLGFVLVLAVCLIGGAMLAFLTGRAAQR
ncbi:MAG: cache domain-containing protein, partial [Pyrinomonadaceae bacterium]